MVIPLFAAPTTGNKPAEPVIAATTISVSKSKISSNESFPFSILRFLRGFYF